MDDVSESTIQQRIKGLLEQISALTQDEITDIEFFDALLSQRQELIDQISAIDESLALVRAAVSESPELQQLLAEIADLDKRLIEWASAHHEQLRASLGNTGRGLKAARGYRLHLPCSPAIISEKA